MAEYKIFFKVSVEKDSRQIPQREMAQILRRIVSLTSNPRPAGSEKLTGQERYRVRQGLYRIFYSIQDNELTIWVVKSVIEKMFTVDLKTKGSKVTLIKIDHSQELNVAANLL